MLSYPLELALLGLRRFPRNTVLAVATVAIGLAACMTTLTLLHQLSADPLPGRSQHLYLAWVDTLHKKPVDWSGTGIRLQEYKRLKLTDAQALLDAHRAMRESPMADESADVATQNGLHTQKNQSALLTTSEMIPMFGVPLISGRSWSRAEDASHAHVAVIDAELARSLFGTTDVLEKTIRVAKKDFRIIGVAAPFVPSPHFYDLGSWIFSATERENLFLPLTAGLDAGISVYGADGCDQDMTGAAKEGMATDPKRCAWLSYWVQLDSAKQVRDYRNFLQNYLKQQKRPDAYGPVANATLIGVADWLVQKNVVPDDVRLNVWLAASFLLLCMVNVAGLLTAKFLRGSNEIGIRRALGAPRRAVFAQHVIEACAVCVAGGLLALPLTLGGLWILRQQQHGFTDMAHLDIGMFAALFGLALLVGVLVGVVPAWRAAAVEPGLQVKSA